ncbi:putative UDP-glucuronosyltransferase [Daphnia magna]|uniref:Putative UDP-glucuronosyltransferase n=1 Tax=Daphnia magna TaxID=35525 RepID=A0A162Q7T6_9CRUS|nr:putative UDP-glucuronosyltransferase [Daphnia magna]
MKLQLFTLVALSALAMESCMGERIVVLYPAGSKSHFYAVMPLLEELAERGHNVTVFSPFKGITKTIKDATEILLASIAQKIDAIDIDWFAMQKEGSAQILSMMRIMTDLSVFACEEMVTNPEFRNIIKNRNVDLFIADAFGNEFLYPIIDNIGIPFVVHGSSSPLHMALDAMGAPKEYASVPTMTLDFDNHMNFFQRLVNVVSGEALKFMRDIFIIAKLDVIVQREFPGHPNARVFITHGGMLGTQESIYHGVPLLGLPFGNDQQANVARAVRDGWGLKLDWNEVDDRILDEAIRHLINDPSVKANVTKWSQLMHDEIMPGKEVAAYWIEYVIRHGDTKHLQLASKNMPFYQRHLIDVAFCLGSIASLFLLIVFMLTRTLLQCYRKRTSEKLKTT